MFVVIQFVFGSVFFFGLVLWLWYWRYRGLPGLGTPIIGTLYDCIANYTSSYKGAVRKLNDHHDKHGDTIAYLFGPVMFVSTVDPILIEELAFHPMVLDKEPWIYGAMHDFFEGAFSDIKADSTWRFHRKAVVLSMSKKHLEIYQRIFTNRTKQLVNVFQNKTGPFDCFPWISLLSTEVILETFFGLSGECYLSEEYFKIHKELNDMANGIVDLMLLGGICKLDMNYMKKRMKFFLEFTDNMMSKLNQKSVNNYNQKPESGFLPLYYNFFGNDRMSDMDEDRFFRIVTEIFVEANYTIGRCLSAGLLHLAVYPEVQEKAWHEQREIFGGSAEPPSQDELKRMEYLERVIKEATRITTQPIVARRTAGDIHAGRTFIPKNTPVLFFWDRLRNDTRYWKKGNKFDPDHFLPEEVAKRPKCAFFGFTAGPRACPGSQYAINYMKVVLSDLIRNFKILSPLKPEQLTYHPAVFSHLDVPHTISLEPRVKTQY